ncbi:MAG: DeoR family transcriptional regulator [Frankiales bacterium]|nr:DeoR family transcriptional regulator [Frankiales bacterium]
MVNPKATATTPRMREVLASALSSEVKLDVAVTQARGHAAELAAQARVDGLDVVVSLGGDGTVNEVVNGLLEGGPNPEGPALAVVPGGNANVFARALGLPNNAVDATSVLLEALAQDRRRRIGLGVVADDASERWFTFCAGLGLDAAVVRRVERKRARGARATPGLFVRQGVKEFFLSRRREPALLLERDGAEPEPLGMALVCNSDPWTYLGPRPVRACPDASFDTGLDLFGVRRLTTVATLRHLRQILAHDARPTGRSLLQVHDAAELRLTAAVPVALQVDGDDLGDRTSVRLRSVPDALDVLV